MFLLTRLHGVTSFKAVILVELILRNVFNIQVAVSRLTGHRALLVDTVRRTVLSCSAANCQTELWTGTNTNFSSRVLWMMWISGDRLPAHRDRQVEAQSKKSRQSTDRVSKDPATCVKALTFSESIPCLCVPETLVYFSRNIQIILSLPRNLLNRMQNKLATWKYVRNPLKGWNNWNIWEQLC
jgi:hypothetical protein